MPAVSCPHCQRPITLTDAHAGKQLRCPNCRQGFQAPVAFPPLDHSTMPAFDFEPSNDHDRDDPEPWFYGIISMCAWLIVGAAGLAFGIGMIVTLKAAQAENVPPHWAAMLMVATIPGLLVLLAFASLLLLSVDIGRTLRKLLRKR